MSKPAITTHDLFPALQRISEDVTDETVADAHVPSDDFSTVSAVMFQKANSVSLFGAAQFASDECGDTLWNEENLNPPLQK